MDSSPRGSGVARAGATNVAQQSVMVRDNICLPCTCKLIKDSAVGTEAGGTPTIVGRRPATIRVRLVGRLTNLKTNNVSSDFSLDDGTGSLHARYWMAGDATDKWVEHMREGQYVEFVGRPDIRIDGPFSRLAKPISNYNWVTLHFLECIHIYLLFTKEKEGNAGPCGEASVSEPLPRGPVVSGPFGEPILGQLPCAAVDGGRRQAVLQPAVASPRMDLAAVSEHTAAISLKEAIIREIADGLESCDEAGVSFEQILQKVCGSVETVRSALDSLMDFGAVYSTVDEDHFRIT
ncbi:unnamed protein product [Urochloa decumbens]|uniref:Replication protein A C-terminal domain-containing protein n=1 Tax=Urochloa decumbens TaxID=240449 RepID=A0ABC8W0F7_9POAL